jgi:hypothetical protein
LIAGKPTGLIPGLFSIGEAAFAEQLRWPLKGFRKAFEEVSSQGMAEADWAAQLIWVPKGIIYNPPANPNVIKGWHHEWSELPECDLKLKAWGLLKQFTEGLDKPEKDVFKVAFAYACPNRYRNPLANGSENPLANSPSASPETVSQTRRIEQENRAGAGELLIESEGGGELKRFIIPPPKMPDLTAFDRFWAIYPCKADKHLAQQNWNSLSLFPEFDPEQLIAALRAQVSAGMLDLRPGREPLLCHNWLNRKKWNDEIRHRQATLPRPSSLNDEQAKKLLGITE